MFIYGAKKPSDKEIRLIDKFQEYINEYFSPRNIKYKVIHSTNKNTIWSEIKSFNPSAIIISGVSPIFTEDYGDIVNLPILTNTWPSPYKNILLLPIYSFSYLVQNNSLIPKTQQAVCKEMDALLRGNTTYFKKLQNA